jgi:FAD/FMN-containing dehydrogenase
LTRQRLTSWGRYPPHPQHGHPVHWQDEVHRVLSHPELPRPTLAFGCGRSYGDSCLAVSDHVLMMSQMNRLLSVDWSSGLIVAEAGLTLAELMDISLPRGWFLPVTPGTKFVTLGGAVANDVHGKNHHVQGTFGRHVAGLTLYRSDAGAIAVSRNERPELFAATVGGLGLTGVILTVELQLRPVSSWRIEERRIRFGELDEFFELASRYDGEYEYTVAWVDCLAGGRSLGRGHFIAGNHCRSAELKTGRRGRLRFPVELPVSLINRMSLPVLNSVIYRGQLRKDVRRSVDYESFFYPLDRITDWNRIYGSAGFQQYQCVVPQTHGKEAIRAILRTISRSGTGSFVTVLKKCGDLASPGLLSFPIQGFSLALDFPQTEGLAELFKRLDSLVHDSGGRLYPAKDAHMNSAHFQRAYPNWAKVEAMRDPLLMSRFWRRVTH